ncbi:hypothetical protein [Sphingobium olei]|uniref:Uncharacterized protein n=1 Tax=Sphingobium olei TaxID=420955 RepID=A0ABW3P1H1_9SPHN
MLILARLLDWLCSAFASGAQDALRINQLICPFSEKAGHRSPRN